MALPLLKPSYHLFADALVWADEVPLRWRRLGIDHVLRPLWHYRTGLVLGEARRFVELWELGKRLFPHWVGFHSSRCQPTRRYIVIYRAGNIAAIRCMAELERQILGADSDTTANRPRD